MSKAKTRRQAAPSGSASSVQTGTRVVSVAAGSIAEDIGIRVGDQLLALNGHPVDDVIDCWFYQNASRLTIEWLGKDRHTGSFSRTVRKSFHEGLGVEIEPFRIRRCRNKCVFCFVHQLPRGLRRELYVKDEDYRLSFLHGNYITCTNLTPNDMQRIVRMKLSPLYVSIHATDEAARGRMLGHKTGKPILPTLKWLTRRRISLHGQIVLCPGINDGQVLDDTVTDLAALGPWLESVAIVPVGLSTHREALPPLEPVTPAYAREFLRGLRKLRKALPAERGQSRLYASDEFYLLAGLKPPSYGADDNLPQISNGVGMYHRFHHSFGRVVRGLPGRLAPPQKVGVITTWMGARVIDKVVCELNRHVDGLEVRVLLAENSLFGPGVTVTGLLPGGDFLRAIRENPGLDRYVIPGNGLRPWDQRFLDDMTLAGLGAKAGATVVAGDETCEGFAEAVLGDATQEPPGPA